MSAYNKFRGSYCAENDYLLNKVLRDEWKFEGIVISDWGGTHSTVNSALNGLDVEMGTERYFNNSLLDSMKQGLVPESVINDKVRRILRVYYFANRKSVPDSTAEVSTPENNNIAYKVATESIVLLKNAKHNLPLDESKLNKITVIGENAIKTHAQGGFGAGVKARYEVTPLEGLKNRVGPSVEIEYIPGYKSKFVKGKRFMPDNTVDLQMIAEAASAASKSETVILFVGNTREVETESSDRKDLMLPFGQDALIKAVYAANRNTILVVVAGAPVNLNIADSCAGTILWSWFNGSQGGNALADVILGRISPSGKLPFTIPVKLEDSPAHALGTFPGNKIATYSEGILVGYRWYDTKNISPKFPFGHGLSYTEFDYSELATDKVKYTKKDSVRISLKVQNKGNRDAKETVQLYISQIDPVIMRPVRELKAFKKVLIPAGKEGIVEMSIPVSSLAWFDEATMKWIISPGKYQLSAGSSSRDIRKVVEIVVK
jgi:beta-glucosidase